MKLPGTTAQFALRKNFVHYGQRSDHGHPNDCSLTQVYPVLPSEVVLEWF
jgi:hypothetical protein